MKPFLPLVSVLLFCSCFLPDSAFAQRFGLGFAAGANLSQMDGDQLFGYRQLGFQAGLIGTAHFDERTYMALELLFSQRGSKASEEEGLGGNTLRQLRLNYAEVPFLLHYRFAQDWDEEYRLDVHGGFSYSRLLGATVEEQVLADGISIDELRPDFSKNQFSLVLGTTFYIRPDLGLALRHSYSLTKLDGRKEFPADFQNLREFWFTLRLVYSIR